MSWGELLSTDATDWWPFSPRGGTATGLPDYPSFLKARNAARGWSFPPHVRLISEELAALGPGRDRLMVTMPPRHGKTENGTVPWSAYGMLAAPGTNGLVTGYNERFARRLGRKVKAEYASAGGAVGTEKSAADEWETAHGGVMMARGVGTPPTGVGFHRIAVDDPIRRREDAESEAYREKTWEWFTDDVSTRLEPGGVMVVTMTLWHEDDLAGRLVRAEPDKWRVLRLPALAEEDDGLGREPGEALWPERYTAADLERQRALMGDYGFSALYQCSPSPRSGAMFDARRIALEPHAAPMRSIVRYWDVAASTSGDWTVGVLMGHGQDGRFWVLDVQRFRAEPSERNRAIRAIAESDGPSVRQWLPQDPGAAGKESAQAFVRLLAGLSVSTETVTGSKEVRSDPLAAQVNAGNVAVLDRDWTRAFVSELASFPFGRHDDQVDAASGAFAKVSTAIDLSGVWVA